MGSCEHHCLVPSATIQFLGDEHMQESKSAIMATALLENLADIETTANWDEAAGFYCAAYQMMTGDSSPMIQKMQMMLLSKKSPEEIFTDVKRILEAGGSKATFKKSLGL